MASCLVFFYIYFHPGYKTKPIVYPFDKDDSCRHAWIDFEPIWWILLTVFWFISVYEGKTPNLGSFSGLKKQWNFQVKDHNFVTRMTIIANQKKKKNRFKFKTVGVMDHLVKQEYMINHNKHFDQVLNPPPVG